MNTLFIFSVILVSSHLVLASKKDVNALLFFSQQTSNNCKTPGLQCKDCQTIQYCSSSNLESLFEIHCEDQSRLRPYCDIATNTCVKDKPAVCELPESSFHCPGTGYYPDLEDCANYYICDENKVATKMSCPTGSNWVQGDQACTSGIYCRSYSPKLGQCKGKTNKLVAYAPDKNMYVLCLSNGPILFQCPNKWEIFDDAEVTCKFECTQNGFFPNPSDPRKFYSCTKEGKGYVSVTLECPEGYEFAELGAGQGICTFRPTTTTTTTTEAPDTTVDLTTILEEYTEKADEEIKNDDEQVDVELEEDIAVDEEAENNDEEEHHTEETVDQNNNEEGHHSEEIDQNNNKEEEIVDQNNNEEKVIVDYNNNEEEQIEEHHSEEILDQSNNDDTLVVEDPEEPAQENDEINNTDEISENIES